MPFAIVALTLFSAFKATEAKAGRINQIKMVGKTGLVDTSKVADTKEPSVPTGDLAPLNESRKSVSILDYRKEARMARKRFTTEQIITRLREVVLLRRQVGNSPLGRDP